MQRAIWPVARHATLSKWQASQHQVPPSKARARGSSAQAPRCTSVISVSGACEEPCQQRQPDSASATRDSRRLSNIILHVLHVTGFCGFCDCQFTRALRWLPSQPTPEHKHTPTCCLHLCFLAIRDWFRVGGITIRKRVVCLRWSSTSKCIFGSRFVETSTS